jgi:PAS domain S-box-containing protein
MNKARRAIRRVNEQLHLSNEALTCARDERERDHTLLKESEEQFRLTLDEAPIGMALVALDGRFIRVNRALCEIVGYSSDELTGLTFQAIAHPDDLDLDRAAANQLVRGETSRYQGGKRYIRIVRLTRKMIVPRLDVKACSRKKGSSPTGHPARHRSANRVL